MACIVWLVGSISLFQFDNRSPKLLSLQAGAFIVVGMFVAAVVVGNITYWIQRKLASVLAKHMSSDPANLANTKAKLERISEILFVFNLLVAAIFLYWVYNSFFLMGD